MRKKTITICTSATFYKQVLEVEKALKKLGYRVLIPITARIMEKNKNFDPSFYKSWLSNSLDYHKKTSFMKGHFRKVLAADAILILNYEKNGIPGYIGGNALMEMTLAFHYRKPIFILNDVSPHLPTLEEIYGLQPFFLKGNLHDIRKVRIPQRSIRP